jgi:penicillin-binding protein 2
LLLVPLGGLQARLVQIQLVWPQESTKELNLVRRTLEVAVPPRGAIRDRQGRVLAEDRRSFDCYLVLEEYEKASGPLARILGMTAEAFQEALGEIWAKIEHHVEQRPPAERRRLYQRERRTPYLLARDIPLEAAMAIETSPDRFGGAVVRESLKRVYPYGSAGCHEVGYLGRVTGNEREFQHLLQSGYFYEGFEEQIGPEGILQLYHRGVFHDQLIGRAGIEKRYDAALRGRLGLLVLERQPGTSAKTLIELLPAEPGEDIELTLDIELEKAVEEILESARGHLDQQSPGEPHHLAAVVLDPRSGEILALASSQGYNPNHFILPGNPAAIRQVLSDVQNKPLTSWAFSQQFQLGSCFKVVTSVAGLEENKVKPEELLPCRGKFFDRGSGFACWIWNEHHSMHNELTLAQALERSCNCYFYEVGRRCELSGVLKWARAFGLGSPTGLDLPSEAPGALPRQQRSENDVLSLAIGQHELMVTPLQAALMMAPIANGGLRVTPHVRRGPAPPPVSLGLSPGTLAQVQKGLWAVTHETHGTALHSGLKELGVSGKTSSAQSSRDHVSHAWFAGYAPEGIARWAVAVFVEHGGHGGEAAAPVARQIFELLSKTP